MQLFPFQERYRSITKQYFRRTDAIVVMYDVTNERSLLNVRQWVEEIREEIDTEDILLFLLGKQVSTYNRIVNIRRTTIKQ